LSVCGGGIPHALATKLLRGQEKKSFGSFLQKRTAAFYPDTLARDMSNGGIYWDVFELLTA
jgi:hypothetical protein